MFTESDQGFTNISMLNNTSSVSKSFRQILIRHILFFFSSSIFVTK